MSLLRAALVVGRRGLLPVALRAASVPSVPALMAADAGLAAVNRVSAWPQGAPASAAVMARGFAAQVQPAPDHGKEGRNGDGGAAAAVDARVAAETGGPAKDGDMAHPELARNNDGTYWLMRPIYKQEYVERIQPKHLPPKTFRERLALRNINFTRAAFDWATGYSHDNMNEKKWLRRILFLETVAGVPGMVGGMLRHLHSLRRMKRDHGWIHTLLEEAENERMHLLTFLQLRQPGPFFRAMVVIAQGVFFNMFFLTYLANPRYCHSFVGYLEEEAVKTYTHAIADLDAGKLPAWEALPAPDVAKRYWGLSENAGMRELLLAVRADEAGHSHVNHVLSNLPPGADNPFAPGSHEVP